MPRLISQTERALLFVVANACRKLAGYPHRSALRTGLPAAMDRIEQRARIFIVREPGTWTQKERVAFFNATYELRDRLSMEEKELRSYAAGYADDIRAEVDRIIRALSNSVVSRLDGAPHLWEF